MSETREKNAKIWQRDDLDHYVEPVRATEQLLTVERFEGPTLDPCCGFGNIVTGLRAGGADAHGADVVRRVGDNDDAATWPKWFCGRQDFLQRGSLKPFRNIVMNPPFFRAKGTEAFIRKALSLQPDKLAVFTDIRFLAGAQRAAGLFSELPPSRIWIITPRVSCPPGSYLAAGNKAGNGSSDWCWIVWDRHAQPDTRIGWLTLVDLSQDDDAEAA
jgi:hypothetical protein